MILSDVDSFISLARRCISRIILSILCRDLFVIKLRSQDTHSDGKILGKQVLNYRAIMHILILLFHKTERTADGVRLRVQIPIKY